MHASSPVNPLCVAGQMADSATNSESHYIEKWLLMSKHWIAVAEKSWP